jgi:hypothetical protein
VNNTLHESACNPQAFTEEIQKYAFAIDREHKHTILPNDFGFTLETNIDSILCTCKPKIQLKKLLNVATNNAPVICYQSCPRVLFTAFLRQLRDSADISPVQPDIKQGYVQYCNDFFNTEIEPLLRDFTYDVDDWMDHITTLNKQLEVLEFYNDYTAGKRRLDKCTTGYTLFAKKEKQILTFEQNGKLKYPKCRAISACPPVVKWVGGPVVLALEKLFHGKLNGYKIGHNGKPMKNWVDIEEMTAGHLNQGFDKVIDIDGSAWDSTQKHHMRTLPHIIYNWLVDNGKIHHVDGEQFRLVMTERHRNLTAKAFILGKSYVVFRALIDSTTFSGSPNTTFDNTIANLVTNHYTLYLYGWNFDDYKLACNGDDTDIKALRVPPDLRNHIDFVWRGLGLIPKMINIGDISISSYCSTHTLAWQEYGRYKCKIVRQLDRMNPLAHWSESALHLSKGQLKQYYLDLKQSYEYWTAEMPIYHDYAIAFKEMADRIPDEPKPMTSGKPKMRFGNKPIELPDYDEKGLFRKSPAKPPDYVVKDFLLQKYGLLNIDIRGHLSSLTNHVLYSSTSEPLA